MRVTYDSNNSGGDWWLSDGDWYALEATGWTVDWVKNDPDTRLIKRDDGDGRWLGALATSASIEADSMEEAIDRWEAVTGQSSYDEGCPCCGMPHQFYSDDGGYR